MNPYRPDRRADRAETERLLDAAHSEATAETASTEPVARLLAAAAAPARPEELAGTEAAVAAFRAARAAEGVTAAPPVARRPHGRRLTTGALAWIGAVAATATAGAAFAAAGLDLTPDPEPPAPTSAPSTSGGTAASPSVAPSRPTPSTTRPGVQPAPPTPQAGASPNSHLHGLCRAWQAKKPAQREKALRTPSFQRLVTAAGGAAEVEAYCQRLVPEAKPGKSTPPSPPGPSTPPESAKVKPSRPAESSPA
ncbi:hypothetical protein V6W11_16990 [Micromonospora profundi]|uniref:hypothetical protein n=1 Tax=Micromonospora profundi TaxID=1420889 RepID=UPI002FF1977F